MGCIERRDVNGRAHRACQSHRTFQRSPDRLAVRCAKIILNLKRLMGVNGSLSCLDKNEFSENSSSSFLADPAFLQKERRVFLTEDFCRTPFA